MKEEEKDGILITGVFDEETKRRNESIADLYAADDKWKRREQTREKLHRFRRKYGLKIGIGIAAVIVLAGAAFGINAGLKALNTVPAGHTAIMIAGMLFLLGLVFQIARTAVLTYRKQHRMNFMTVFFIAGAIFFVCVVIWFFPKWIAEL